MACEDFLHQNGAGSFLLIDSTEQIFTFVVILNVVKDLQIISLEILRLRLRMTVYVLSDTELSQHIARFTIHTKPNYRFCIYLHFLTKRFSILDS